MFIHGSTKSLGSVSNSASRGTNSNTIGCTPACGSHDETRRSFGISTFCDAECLNHEPPAGCGAGDPSKFGPSCRACSNEHIEPLNGEHEGLQHDSAALFLDEQAIMCNMKKPSESIICTQECREDPNTVRTSGSKFSPLTKLRIPNSIAMPISKAFRSFRVTFLLDIRNISADLPSSSQEIPNLVHVYRCVGIFIHVT